MTTENRYKYLVCCENSYFVASVCCGCGTDNARRLVLTGLKYCRCSVLYILEYSTCNAYSAKTRVRQEDGLCYHSLVGRFAQCIARAKARVRLEGLGMINFGNIIWSAEAHKIDTSPAKLLRSKDKSEIWMFRGRWTLVTQPRQQKRMQKTRAPA
jgi:hypothetical protein